MSILFIRRVAAWFNKAFQVTPTAHLKAALGAQTNMLHILTKSSLRSVAYRLHSKYELRNCIDRNVQ